MTAAVAPRRIAAALLLAALILGACFDCERTWEADAAPHVVPARTAAPGVHEPAPWSCGPVEGGGTYCATHDVPSPGARMVAVALLQLKVRRSLVVGGIR